MFSISSSTLVAATLCSLFFTSSVSAHGLVAKVKGANNVQTTGFGLIAGTPRDGVDEQPFQLDTSVFKNLNTNPCGETLGGGTVDITKELAKVQKQGGGQLPALDSNMAISMTIHQVNADGGGPFNVFFNTDATGKNWTQGTVLKQVPGVNGVVSGAPLDSEFQAAIPAGTQCTGGTNGNACLLRVTNGGTANSFANGAGPFGSCLAVQAPSNSNNNSSNNSNNNNARDLPEEKAKAPRRLSGAAKGKARMARRLRGSTASLHDSHIEHERGVHLDTRSAFVQDLVARANSVRPGMEAIKKRMLEKRISLSTIDMSEITTVLGTAMDVAVDAVAGINSNNPTGGRSNINAKTQTLSLQQSENLKQAIRDSLSAGLAALASNAAQAPNPTDQNIVANADASASKALAAGVLTSTTVIPTASISGGALRAEANVNGLGVTTHLGSANAPPVTASAFLAGNTGKANSGNGNKAAGNKNNAGNNGQRQGSNN